MPIGFPSIRVRNNNPKHHLWNNNGTWWIHFTVHFDHRKRRIRRSLATPSLAEAIQRRDQLLQSVKLVGHVVPERGRDVPAGPPALAQGRRWAVPKRWEEVPGS